MARPSQKGGTTAAEEDHAPPLSPLGLRDPEKLMDIRGSHQPHDPLSGADGGVAETWEPAVAGSTGAQLERVVLETQGTHLSAHAYIDEYRGLESSGLLGGVEGLEQLPSGVAPTLVAP
ncbi:MAG TPA: hypothetical protein VEY88_25500 [Archangium sp.]|nr:hypothetical protein [Archangium sp.]